MNPQAVIQQVTALATKDDSIAALWLYGSRTKGTAGPDSDYDLAVKYYDYLKDPLKNRLRPELLAMDWHDVLGREPGVELSVVDIELVPTPLAAAIIDHGILLMDKAPLETAWLYQKIWSKWDDWKYHRSANMAG
jgi:predicted nucleotidyltransferase